MEDFSRQTAVKNAVYHTDQGVITTSYVFAPTEAIDEITLKKMNRAFERAIRMGFELVKDEFSSDE